jgi:diguanylate cyclase (GGDEF)-like protein/PAS domain S-box-containing protein
MDEAPSSWVTGSRPGGTVPMSRPMINVARINAEASDSPRAHGLRQLSALREEPASEPRVDVLAIAPGVSIDCLPSAVAVIDACGNVRRANARWWALVRCAPAANRGANIREWFPDAEAVAVLHDAAAANRAARLGARRADGVPVTVTIEASLDPASGCLFCIAREMAGDDLLEESQRYLDVAFESAPIGMALFDTSGRYVRVNDALCHLLGRRREDLIGRRDQELTHPDDRQSDIDASWRILRGELDTWQTEKRFLHASGEVVWVIANLTFLRDQAGRPLSWLGQFQDITERRQREELLGHLAVHDELTGIANRRGLMQELSDRLVRARRYAESGAVLILDLDGFKDINDQHGHQAGDALLKTVAHALRERLRRSDFLARLGGDEFAVILPHADAGAAAAVAELLLAAVRQAGCAPLSASCGISLYDSRADNVDAVLDAADHAMYQAKASGRNQACRDAAGA